MRPFSQILLRASPQFLRNVASTILWMFVGPVALDPFHPLWPPVELKHCYLHPLHQIPHNNLLDSSAYTLRIVCFQRSTTVNQLSLVFSLALPALLSRAIVFCFRHALYACRSCRQLVPVLEGDLQERDYVPIGTSGRV